MVSIPSLQQCWHSSSPEAHDSDILVQCMSIVNMLNSLKSFSWIRTLVYYKTHFYQQTIEMIQSIQLVWLKTKRTRIDLMGKQYQDKLLTWDGCSSWIDQLPTLHVNYHCHQYLGGRILFTVALKVCRYLDVNFADIKQTNFRTQHTNDRIFQNKLHFV